MSRQRRKRYRGVYISPVIVLGAAVLLLAAIFLLRGRGEAPAGGGEAPAGGEEAPSDRVEEVQSGEQSSQPQGKSLRVTGGDGTDYVLTDLGGQAIHSGDLVLVNNWTFYQFPAEEELVNVYEERNGDYIVARTDILLRRQAMDELNRMLADFRAQGGSRTVNVVAGHRTEEFQQHLFDQSAERNGLEHAKKYVAQPGGSEHHTGLVVDLSIFYPDGSSGDYDGTGEYAWINDNCHDYGYVVRYAEDKAALTGIADEPWHFRYLGIPHATRMVEEGLCMEEYMDYLKDYSFEDPLTIRCAAGTYESWYTAGSEVYLPQSGDYQVSGNNTDGIIITRRVA